MTAGWHCYDTYTHFSTCTISERVLSPMGRRARTRTHSCAQAKVSRHTTQYGTNMRSCTVRLEVTGCSSGSSLCCRPRNSAFYQLEGHGKCRGWDWRRRRSGHTGEETDSRRGDIGVIGGWMWGEGFQWRTLRCRVTELGWCSVCVFIFSFFYLFFSLIWVDVQKYHM